MQDFPGSLDPVATDWRRVSGLNASRRSVRDLEELARVPPRPSILLYQGMWRCRGALVRIRKSAPSGQPCYPWLARLSRRLHPYRGLQIAPSLS